MAREEVVTIRPPRQKTIELKIIGEMPLLMHRLGKKLQEEFMAKYEGKAKKTKKGSVRDFEAEFLDSIHYIDKSYKEAPNPQKLTSKTMIGFPSSGFKQAMVAAARQYDNLKMSELRGRFFVCNEFVEIKGKPEMQQFWRRVGSKGKGTGTPDIGCRAIFPEWEATLYIRYNADCISADSIANLLATAGMSEGIGEDRPGKSGNSYGTWRVA